MYISRQQSYLLKTTHFAKMLNSCEISVILCSTLLQVTQCEVGMASMPSVWEEVEEVEEVSQFSFIQL
jgi:hypothetical protein